MRKKLQRLKGNHSDSHKNVTLKSFWSFLLNFGSKGLGLVISLLLARMLGSQNYGDYVFAFSFSNLIAILAVFGMDKLLVREVSQQRIKNNFGLINGISKWSGNAILSMSIFIGTLVFAFSMLNFEVFDNNQALWCFQIGIIAAIFQSLLTHRRSMMIGIKEQVSGQVPEKVVRPLVFIILLLVLYYYRNEKFNAISAVLLNTIALIITFSYSTILFRKLRTSKKIKKLSSGYKSSIKAGMVSLLAISLISALYERLDVLMLGFLQGDTIESGIYSVAYNLALIVNFVHIAYNTILSPSISELKYKNKLASLQTLLVKSTRTVILFSVPIIALLIFGGETVLSWFKHDFINGYYPMIILIGSNIFHILTGMVGNVLLMTHNDKYFLFSLIITTILNLILNLILIPKYGMTGAAISTACCSILNNIIMLYLVKVKLGINPTFFGKTTNEEA